MDQNQQNQQNEPEAATQPIEPPREEQSSQPAEATDQPPAVAGNQAPSGSETAVIKTPQKKNIVLGLVAALLVITVAGVFLAIKVFGNNPDLSAYKSEQFSISYPENFEQRTEDGAVAFTEPGEEADVTRSGVIVSTEDISGLTDEQRKLLENNLIEQIDAFAKIAASGNNREIKSRTTKEVTLSGHPAQRVDAELFAEGQKVADFYIAAGLTGSKLSLVAVLVHTSDPVLNENAQAIIDSFSAN